MPCTGRVSPLHLLEALAGGADGAMVAGCLEGQCHYREGNFNAIDRVLFVQRLLDSVGVEPERVRMFTMSAGEPPKFVAAVREMDRTIGALPPLDEVLKMPLTHRGHEMLERLPAGDLRRRQRSGLRDRPPRRALRRLRQVRRRVPDRRQQAWRELRREPAPGRAAGQPAWRAGRRAAAPSAPRAQRDRSRYRSE